MTKQEYARRQRKLSIAALSARTRVSAPFISLLENGRGTPTPDQAQRLARALGMAPEQLPEDAPELEAPVGDGRHAAGPESPWLTVKQAAARMQVGPKTVYRSVAAGRLRAARVGGRRDLRFLAAWVDEFLITTSQPIEIVQRRIS